MYRSTRIGTDKSIPVAQGLKLGYGIGLLGRHLVIAGQRHRVKCRRCHFKGTAYRSYTSKHDCITGIGILYGDTVVGTCRNDGRSPYIADPSTRYTRTDYAVRCRTARNSSYQSIAAVRLALGLQVYVVLSQLGMNPY